MASTTTDVKFSTEIYHSLLTNFALNLVLYDKIYNNRGDANFQGIITYREAIYF
jgi:hypothetical protein